VSDFLNDPLWYKDAVIYELHVRSFFDANNDGFGDFAGLREKLPYIESLGVNCVWLLPFLESPLKDDGYDTADYKKILPVHGSLEEFQAFLDEAHSRGIRVITELVLNHTSDQHPWFQEARNPDSPKHDWYVWTDTPEKYKEARIIFTDTEHSNWTWDGKAGKYYWHRFFSHQPDLNFDNPDVHEAVKEVLFYWLDMGVDGLRLDAVPYLYEREGTSCENLPETLEFIKVLRKDIEERYGPGKVMLAEANQWPEDTIPYFGDGEGVQMAFNFPIMPRMYMALRRENRRPLVEMLELTKDIPDDAQWAIFLRNHDELTLEMVTDEERDYMYHEYAEDPRFRINVGIRRRLAPLLAGERRRIELMNVLLLSLKGSPVIYYGDEIGMGDDPFLGDRNGVRTPMHWSPDKNGGFSRAPHYRLFMPAIGRGRYSYEFINVEEAESDPHSLLHFTRRILALRRQYGRVFGRGTFEVLPVDNQSVLAFVREHEGERILVVANLSRFSQSAFLPPDSGLEGSVPVELFGQTPFPPFREGEPYHLPLAPHGYYWFALESVEDYQVEDGRIVHQRYVAAQDVSTEDLPTITVTEGIENLLVRTLARDKGVEQLESHLPGFLTHQRWFGAKSRGIASVTVEDAVRIAGRPKLIYLSMLKVTLEDGGSELYTLPLGVLPEDETASFLQEHPAAAVAWLRTPDSRQLLHDATARGEFWLTLFDWWRTGGKGRSLKGLYESGVSADIAGISVDEARPLTGEQSNSAAILGDRFFMKLYRRLERGINPETEMLDYLSKTGFRFVPKLHGTLAFRRSSEHVSVGILQEALKVESDGWEYAIESMRRFLDRVADSTPPPPNSGTGNGRMPAVLEDVGSEMLSLASVVGVRTAEMHMTLARADSADLRPEDVSEETLGEFARTLREEAVRTRQLVDGKVSGRDQPRDADWGQALRRIESVREMDPSGQLIRVHGDYHLGQLIRAEGEFYVLDFEGEPARSIDERRRRDSALRDVAGMLRSLDYATLAAWKEHSYEDEHHEQWTELITRWCQRIFLNAYLHTTSESNFLPDQNSTHQLLWLYLLEKALYEIRYEINHRPDWAWLPLRGLRRLLEEPEGISTHA
jgi:maltose alpha-D-glucosyltransferase / alpha-amylase